MDPVAIVGLSLRYPGFCGPAAFFDSCRSSRSRLSNAEREVVRPYLQDHPRGISHPYRINNDLYGSIRDISWIDARRFRVPPSDIEGDPSPFICLQVASEALIDYQAGRSDDCIPRERTGVVIGRGDHPHRGLWSGLEGGSGFELIRELLLERQDLFTIRQVDALVDILIQRMKPYPNPSIAASLVSNVISGLVANRLDLQGPNFLVDAACTSAIVAIQQAIRSLEDHESDLMLVGASQATMAIPIIQMFSMLGAISVQDVQPFNQQMSGTLLSEGVGFVALKRLEDARRDADRIYAVIRGLGLASDGNDTAILAPSSRGQILAMRNTYDSLEGIEPDDIGFLEAHATGINLGDDTELTSIHAIFNPKMRKRPLVLGALKSLIGHTIPASGMAALIRSCYAVAFGVYPNSRCDQPDERLISSSSGLFLPSVMSPWYERPSVPRRAAINCFGFGGINGHLVIEQEMLVDKNQLLYASGVLSHHKDNNKEACLPEPDSYISRVQIDTGCPVYIVCLSFNDETELLLVARQALNALPEMVTCNISCRHFISGPSQAGTYRIGLVYRSTHDIEKQLRILIEHPGEHHAISKPNPENTPSIAVMLPGEALIPFGQLSELARFIPSVKSLLEFVDSTSSDGSILGDFIHPAWGSVLSASTIQALQEAANHHDRATKILFVVSIAYCGLLRLLGVEPSAFVGHSTGEINALMLAGGFQCSDKQDIQKILRSFDDLYTNQGYLDSLEQGVVVLAAGLDDITLSSFLQMHEDVYLVSDNSPSHRLLYSGTRDFDELSALIGEYGGFVLPTQLDRAYHTSLFSAGAEVMRRFYQQFNLSPLASPVYSCCSTEPYPPSASLQIDLLVHQWTQPVRFRQALLNMYRDGYRCFLELNASKTLLGFAESTFYGKRDVSLLSTGTSKDSDAIDCFAHAVVGIWKQGVSVKWEQWDSLFTYSHDLSLAEIKRPESAVTIHHELHRLDPIDYIDAWSAMNDSNIPATSDSTFSKSTGEPSEGSFVEESGAGMKRRAPTPAFSTNAIGHHQQTMRRALDSIDQNTRLTISRLK